MGRALWKVYGVWFVLLEARGPMCGKDKFVELVLGNSYASLSGM